MFHLTKDCDLKNSKTESCIIASVKFHELNTNDTKTKRFLSITEHNLFPHISSFFFVEIGYYIVRILRALDAIKRTLYILNLIKRINNGH